MNKCSLVIMAAGLGSRFKGGVKQLEAIGPTDEIIMDYSIYDAYQAGFRKVVLIIREELEDIFKDHFKNLYSDLELKFVFQKTTDIPEAFKFDRTKPWGTGQAILICKKVINEPFIVINADDYYGKEAFNNAYQFLKNNTDFYMAGFILKNTLSDYGSVNRGICKVDLDNNLIDIEEIFNIEKQTDVARGQTVNGEEVILDENSFASMNFFGFRPSLFEELEIKFNEFLTNIKDINKDEFLLPTIIKNMIYENKIKLKVIETNDKWFGMTYYEDKIIAKTTINKYIEEGYYPEKLF